VCWELIHLNDIKPRLILEQMECIMDFLLRPVLGRKAGIGTRRYSRLVNFRPLNSHFHPVEGSLVETEHRHDGLSD